MDTFRYEKEEDNCTTVLELSSWLNPTQELNYKSAIRKLDKSLRKAIFLKCGDSFDSKLFVFDLKVSDSGVKKGKSSYMAASITLFKNQETCTVDPILEEIGKVLSSNQNFEFRKFKHTPQ